LTSADALQAEAQGFAANLATTVRAVVGEHVEAFRARALHRPGRLQRGRRLHQLVPVAHQLPACPHRRRCDPGLRQPTHPQQIGGVAGVADVIFHRR
jgi:hypothetical protein